MPLNPHLIKPDLDGDSYANAAPTIGTLALAHFSSPERHNELVYGTDSMFFATNQSRKMYLRHALRNEFDIYTNESDYQTRPMLWLLVQQTAPMGHHMILPVWRGKAFWNTLNSDEEVANVVERMCLRQGLSLGEWHSWVCDERVRKTDAARLSKRSKKPMVN
jgi:hypothetical protein